VILSLRHGDMLIIGVPDDMPIDAAKGIAEQTLQAVADNIGVILSDVVVVTQNPGLFVVLRNEYQ
jgi:hypothetical protein